MENPFDDLARELPDGAFWPTGKWFKKFLRALAADRARPGANIDELPSDKGRFFNAKAGGDPPAAAIPALTVVDASDSAHPGRVRVYKGRLCGRLPAEMHLLDIVLPDGTDNRCYLTMPEGLAYVYGKALVDDEGLVTGANAYEVTSEEALDGTYLYLMIAVVVTTSGKPSIYQEWTGGNWNPAPATSADGTILIPVGQSL